MKTSLCNCKHCGAEPHLATYVSIQHGKQQYYACYKTRECRLDGNNMFKHMNEVIAEGNTFDAVEEWNAVNTTKRKRKTNDKTA